MILSNSDVLPSQARTGILTENYITVESTTWQAGTTSGTHGEYDEEVVCLEGVKSARSLQWGYIIPT
jgi:hypothetical protein